MLDEPLEHRDPVAAPDHLRVHPVELATPDLEHRARRRTALPIRIEVELEVDPVVELEAHGQLPEVRLAPSDERLAARDTVSDPRMERAVVVGHEARVVDEPVLLDELERRGG